MTQLNLPEPIAAYFDADERGGDAVAQCFTPQGAVVDEGQTHRGPVAIAAWKTAASANYSYRSEPLAIEKWDGRFIVTSRVVGNFAGSPVELRYSFALEGGQIASLEIAP